MKNEYLITLPDGDIVHVWFIGKILERILDAYEIPYKNIERKKGK